MHNLYQRKLIVIYANLILILFHPKIIKTKVYKNHPNSQFDSKQNTIQNIHLALVTSIISMPKITDELNPNSSAFENFRNNLKNIQLECSHLAPELLECSISL